MLISWVIISQILTNDIWIYLDVAFRCQHGKSTSFFENAPALNLQLCSGIRFVFSEGYRIFFMYLLSMLLYNVLTYMFGYFSGEMLGNHGYFSMNDRGVYWFSFPIKMQILWWVWWSGTCQAIFLGVDFLTLALTLDMIYIYTRIYINITKYKQCI